MLAQSQVLPCLLCILAALGRLRAPAPAPALALPAARPPARSLLGKHAFCCAEKTFSL